MRKKENRDLIPNIITHVYQLPTFFLVYILRWFKVFILHVTVALLIGFLYEEWTSFPLILFENAGQLCSPHIPVMPGLSCSLQLNSFPLVPIASPRVQDRHPLGARSPPHTCTYTVPSPLVITYVQVSRFPPTVFLRIEVTCLCT